MKTTVYLLGIAALLQAALMMAGFQRLEKAEAAIIQARTTIAQICEDLTDGSDLALEDCTQEGD